MEKWSDEQLAYWRMALQEDEKGLEIWNSRRAEAIEKLRRAEMMISTYNRFIARKKREIAEQEVLRQA